MRNKKRVSITLSPAAVEKVEATIDGDLITNRSLAVEHLIEQGFTEQLQTAVILAGGDKITDLSNVLKKIEGRYLLSIMIDQLKKYSVHKIILCSGDNIQQIQDEFGDGSESGVELEYVQEKRPMGTAGALKLTQDKLASRHFLLLYGDILTNINFNSMAKFHFMEDRIATLGIKPRMGQRKYGQVILQGSSVVGYADKAKNVGLSLVNTGLYAFSDQIFSYIKADQQQYLGRDIIPQLISDQELGGFIFQGMWFDISAAEDYQAAVKRWSNKQQS